MKKFKASFLVIIFTLSTILFTTSAIAESVERADEITRAKISPELLVVMAESSSDDLIPVYLRLKNIDDKIITSALTEEKGMDPLIYENDERFYEEIVPPLEAEVVARVGYDAAHYKEIPSELSNDIPTNVKLSAPPNISNLSEYAFKYEDIEEFDWNMSLVDRVIHMKADEYMMAKREIVEREYSRLNDAFIEEHIGNKQRKILFNGRFISTIIVEATKAEIESYSKMKIVEEITFYVEIRPEPALSEVLGQVNADSGQFGTKSSSFNAGAGYKGTGIIIGIIEAQRGRYDGSSNAPMLSGIPSNRLRMDDDAGFNGSTIFPIVRNHATMVTSLIIGQSVTVSGRTFEGVVPLATVIQTPTEGVDSILRAFENLARKGVHVINFSAGTNIGTGYYDFDKDIDRLINSTSVAFIVSAGNIDSSPQLDVLSPGKALDAITVGNAITKSNSNTPTAPPYLINNTNDGASCFNHVSYIPNKPDIAAPGTYIGYVSRQNNQNFVYYYSGTSFAAPIVTGIAAQIIQARPNLKFNPDTVKSILIAGAFNVIIQTPPTDSTNTSVSNGNHLWTKSGAGLVNARNSVLIAERNTYRSIAFIASSNWSFSLGNLSAGQRIRVVMTFSRSTYSSINSTSDYDDLDIRIFNSSGTSIASSISGTQNVEIIEFTVPSNGSYNVVVYPFRLKSTNPPVWASVSWRTI